MKNVREPTYSFVILTFVLIIINTLLARLSVIAFPAGPGEVSWLYFAIAFMIIFTLWFGAYGAIAAYVGTLGAGLLGSLGSHPDVALFWSLAGLLQVLLPLVAIRTFDVDINLENRRDIISLLIFGIVINNFIGAVWGTGVLALGGIIATSDLGSTFTVWFLSNLAITLIIVPPILRIFTPRIRKSKLFVKYYWD
jgi:integral membrane sensor domain MASE1